MRLVYCRATGITTCESPIRTRSALSGQYRCQKRGPGPRPMTISHQNVRSAVSSDDDLLPHSESRGIEAK